MSGRWSRACDEQSVGDSHRSPARSAQLALTYITHALIAIEDGEDPALHIARAGAYVRAWRKSLPDQSGRRGRSDEDAAAPTCLVTAGRMVMLASLPFVAPEAWLGVAETNLRSAWKQATR